MKTNQDSESAVDDYVSVDIDNAVWRVVGGDVYWKVHGNFEDAVYDSLDLAVVRAVEQASGRELRR